MVEFYEYTAHIYPIRQWLKRKLEEKRTVVESENAVFVLLFTLAISHLNPLKSGITPSVII